MFLRAATSPLSLVLVPSRSSRPARGYRERGGVMNNRTPPVTLPVIPDSIPAELKDLPQWVGWSWAYRPGKNGEAGEWTKPPLSPVTGHKASSTDSGTWASFADALRFVQACNLPGIGRVVNRDDPYVGIDLDDCRDPETGEIDPRAQEIIDRFDSYAELTPSGTGVHIIITTDTGLLPEAKRGGREGSVEIYGDGRYLTFTGQRLSSAADIAERTDELAAFCAEVFGPATR